MIVCRSSRVRAEGKKKTEKETKIRRSSPKHKVYGLHIDMTGDETSEVTRTSK